MNLSELSRRRFLQLGLGASAGLLIGCGSNDLDPIASFATTREEQRFRNAWLHIAPDGDINFIVPSVEMGQGVQTALTMLVADEMDADWKRVSTSFAPYDPAFDNPKYFIQVTGGSNSVSSYWLKLRKLGAAARSMLVAAAAQAWDVKALDCTVADSVVSHPSGRSLGFGALAQAASQLPPPKDPVLKTPDRFRLIGRSVPRLDTPAKISGGAIYGIDVTLPGMLYATVAQSPVFGGRVVSHDEAAAMAMPGVRKVVQLDNGIAVVADSHWRALNGLEALAVTFDDGPHAHRSSADFTRMLEAAMQEMDEDPLPDAAKVLDVSYQAPFLAHQPLEPMNCTAHVTPTSCRLWVPTQNPHGAAAAAASVTGLPREEIEVNVTQLGGGFGRRLENDYVAQAVAIAKQVDAPVRLLWTREEDMQHDFYRPVTRARFRIALGADGTPTAWHTKIAAPSSFQKVLDDNFPEFSWLPVQALLGDVNMLAGLGTSFMQGNPFPYPVGDLKTDDEIMDIPVPNGSHRSVQHSFSGFCKEAAIDECAHAAGEDPLAYRRRLLAAEPRYLGVIDLVAEKSDWGRPPPGRFQGLAVHRSFDTLVAEVAEISFSDDGTLRIHRIVCAVDCGIVVNPAIAESQVHGAVLWGLENTLRCEITIAGGRVEQSNFHDYEVLHLHEAPEVEVHFVPSAEPPTGLGEPGAPPVAAALTNAIFAATGRRIRTLPLSRHGLSI